MTTLPILGSTAAAIQSTLANPLTARLQAGSPSLDSFANSFAGTLAQMLQSSGNGSQFEIGIAPASRSGSAPGQFTITVRNVTGGTAAAGAGDASPNSGLPDAASVGDASTVSDVATSPKRTSVSAANPFQWPSPQIQPWQRMEPSQRAQPGQHTDRGGPHHPPVTASGYPRGAEDFIAEFGSGATSAPEPPIRKIATPDFYQPPPVQSVKGVKTLESVMQEELVLVQHGTSQLVNGTWNLKYLTDSFEDQAQRVIMANKGSTDPSLAPANWAEIAGQYKTAYLEWLTTTDASYWDPKLSGSVYDAASGIVQTSNGPVDANGAPAQSPVAT
jgi:hypothetical protein